MSVVGPVRQSKVVAPGEAKQHLRATRAKVKFHDRKAGGGVIQYCHPCYGLPIGTRLQEAQVVPGGREGGIGPARHTAKMQVTLGLDARSRDGATSGKADHLIRGCKDATDGLADTCNWIDLQKCCTVGACVLGKDMGAIGGPVDIEARPWRPDGAGFPAFERYKNWLGKR